MTVGAPLLSHLPPRRVIVQLSRTSGVEYIVRNEQRRIQCRKVAHDSRVVVKLCVYVCVFIWNKDCEIWK